MSGLFNCEHCADTKKIRVKGGMHDIEREVTCPHCAPLPDPTKPDAQLRRGSRQTERAAHALVLPRSGTQRERVLVAMYEAGDEGLTDEELRAKLPHLTYSSAGTRRLELVGQGWLQDSGRTRPTTHGGEATVWRLSDRAKRQNGR